MQACGVLAGHSSHVEVDGPPAEEPIREAVHLEQRVKTADCSERVVGCGISGAAAECLQRERELHVRHREIAVLPDRVVEVVDRALIIAYDVIGMETGRITAECSERCGAHLLEGRRIVHRLERFADLPAE